MSDEVDHFSKRGAAEPGLRDVAIDPMAGPASDLLRSIEADFQRIAMLMDRAIEENADGTADETVGGYHYMKQAAEKGAAIARRR